MAFIVLEHKGIIQCEVYMCVTIWKIFMYFFMWLYVFFLKFSWRQTWVTKEKGLALFVLKRWIWLISNWSHANVVMRFCPFLLLLNLEIFQLLHLEVETVCFQGFSVIHLSFVHLFSVAHTFGFGASFSKFCHLLRLIRHLSLWCSVFWSNLVDTIGSCT